MTTTFVWVITPLETPRVEKHCPRCDHQRFVCSNKFRINSQKKIIDVWLVYKCEHCEFTWKMDIIVRKNVTTIPAELFRQFQANDKALAWHYAFDKNTLHKNKVQMDWQIPWVLQRQSDVGVLTTPRAQVALVAPYDLSISLRKILQQWLGCSQQQLERYVACQTLIVNGDARIKLSKHFGRHCAIDCDAELLKKLLV